MEIDDGGSAIGEAPAHARTTRTKAHRINRNFAYNVQENNGDAGVVFGGWSERSENIQLRVRTRRKDAEITITGRQEGTELVLEVRDNTSKWVWSTRTKRTG